MFPLTPAEAIAVGVTLTTHPRRLPHWQGWADRLKTWGQQQLQTEHETETDPIPSENEPKHSGPALNPDQVDVPLTKKA